VANSNDFEPLLEISVLNVRFHSALKRMLLEELQIQFEKELLSLYPNPSDVAKVFKNSLACIFLPEIISRAAVD
jgi:hypothetical protein